MADSRETMWAEFYRAAAELELPPNMLMPRNVWQLNVDLHAVADLRLDEALDQLGLPPPEPTSEQWPVYQAVGERLHAQGLEGILWRSAARPEGLCACIFEPALTGVKAAGEPELVFEPPAPPRGLRT